MKKLIYTTFLLITALAFLRFTLGPSAPSPTPTLNLKWYKAYPGESWGIVRTGMLWSFSYLGATLPKDSFDRAVVFIDSTTFNVNLAGLGFDGGTLQHFEIICDSIKKSEEYKRNNSIDLARFFMLTLYSPHHYYKITGVEPKLESFQKKYGLRKAVRFGVTNSTVGRSHRLIKFSKDTTLFHTGFLAEEGHGSLTKRTFKPEEFEVFDLMRNGQFRYAVYNNNGLLAESADDSLSVAGKIGKCMWCHETYVQPLFKKNEPVRKMLSNDDFKKNVSNFQTQFERYRATLLADIDFRNSSDHTASELLYISYLEPSLYRLCNELKKDSLELKKLLGEKTHVYEEFPFLGKLYHRKEIEQHFSYTRLRVPSSARERSTFEPNYIK